MKKMMMTAMMILVAALCCFAGTHTHTITLVSVVEKQDAQYVIRNAETGATGASVIYCTDEISRQDVSTSFDIIQCNDSNGINTVRFTVSATELQARVGGKLYSTKGVQVLMGGQGFGSEVSFTRTTVGAVAAGTAVESFEVIWPTDAGLVDATYEACIVLTATSL